MGQPVPEDDLPGSVVPESDLPNTAVPESDISTVSQPGQPMEAAPEPSAVPQLPVTGYGPGMFDAAKSAAMATPMGQNVGRVMQPYAAGASKLMSQYAANPLTKLAPDLVAAASGVPPPFATAQAIGSTQGAYNVAKNLPRTVPGPVDPLLQTEFGRETARRVAAAEAEALANRTMIQKIAMSKIVQTAAPVLNTAARVAGPAGLAYNANEAFGFARDAQLGERLAQGQGRLAQKQFRNMNVQYGTGTSPGGRQGFNNTLTADQARSIISSGNQRDIQAFGGLDFLRKKALGQ